MPDPAPRRAEVSSGDRHRRRTPSIQSTSAAPLNVFSVPPIADAAPFISAGAGVAGVVVALSGELLRRRWQQPRLRLLALRPEKGDAVFFVDAHFDDKPSAWIRLGVRNEGRETARDVEVHIEDIVPIGPGPNNQRVEAFQKQQLALLFGRRLSWADREDRTVDIPRGMVRRVDIAHVSTGEPSYSIGTALAVPIRFSLDHASWENRRNVVAGLEYDLQLSISAANCQTTFFNARVEFGGIWLGEDSANPLVDGSLRIVLANARRDN
jgi:hypothetical protein